MVVHGEKWCRPQPVSRNNVRVAAENGPSVSGKRFGLFACGVVFLWVFLRVFDFTLIPPAYNGILLTGNNGISGTPCLSHRTARSAGED